MESRIIVALDDLTETQALDLANFLRGKVWGFKVNDLLDECGAAIVAKLRNYGNVFADPKIHDIPNTALNRVKRYLGAGACLITVHASGGISMMKASIDATKILTVVRDYQPRILAVSVLTSLTEDEAHLIFGAPIKAKVLQFARYAVLAGVHGIVCSPQELAILNQPELAGLIKVTPGIRPAWHQKPDDQKRSMTPAEAIKLGANYLVIGRPITKAADPLEAVEKTNAEIEAALASIKSQ